MDTKQFIKQLFCKHIYKDDGEELLKTREEEGLAVTWEVKTYAIFQTCIKCGKKIVYTIRVRK
jgi:hypothetical protein